jgi:mannan endo-1,4-beta-mannosidase
MKQRTSVWIGIAFIALLAIVGCKAQDEVGESAVVPSSGELAATATPTVEATEEATPTPTKTLWPSRTPTIVFTPTMTHTPPNTLTPRPSFPGADLPPFTVEGRFLYDGCGELVVLRGVNKMVIWTDRDGDPAFQEITKTGANAVRVVWLTEGTAEELDIVLQNAINNQLIPMVDLHGAIGNWKMLPELVDYWVRPDIVEVLQRYEAFVIVNIANEIASNVRSVDQIAGYTDAILRMREAGLRMPLVIDASFLGKGIQHLDPIWEPLLEVDPLHNLMFSVHTYWTLKSGYDEETITSKILHTVDQEMPLMIGEFGHQWSNDPDEVILYQHIMALSQEYQIGYFPWSWGPGNRPQVFLDMTEDGMFDTLQGWGLEVAITDPNSIMNTSVRPYSIVHGECAP